MSLLRKIVRWPKRHVALFITLLAVMLLQPAMHELSADWIVYNALTAVVALAVLLFVFDTRRERFVSLLLAAPGLVGNFAAHFTPTDYRLGFELVLHVSSLIFYGYAAGVILHGIIERRAVRADDVIGALCSYLLLGLCWSSLYQVTDLLAPGSFAVHSDMGNELENPHSRQALFNYFSFVTLTTLGYGDVTPVSHVAATFAWLEATIGQFYIAVVVAQVVGFRMAHATSKSLSGS